MAAALKNEKTLLARSRRGDDDAYEQIIAAYSPALYRIVMRMDVDSQEAELIVQETFWRIWRSLNKINIDQPIFPYLTKTALNFQKDQWRKLKDDEGLEDDQFEEIRDEDGEHNPEEVLVLQEQLKQLSEAVNQLPAPYRLVISLRYEGQLSYDEIAITLEIPLNTVRTHLRRAKHLLRVQMEDADE
jgi:RNA polymerase sigma-70 factor (ECF subfamily)